jgi:hypothetical protein
MRLYPTVELAPRIGVKFTCEGTPAGGTVFPVNIPDPE